MITNKKIFIAILFFSVIFIGSCSKEIFNTNNGAPVVQLRIEGVDFLNSSTNKASALQETTPKGLEVQRQIIPLTDNISVFATLIPETTSSNDLENKFTPSKRADNQPVVHERELAVGTKFMVLVYNSSNQLIAERQYTYAPLSADQDNQLKYENLEVGQTYTFVVYSINSKENLPQINNKQNLLNASLPNISSELLYFKKNLTVSSGLNYLNVKLKHQFSEVRTTIEVDQTGDLEGSLLTDIATPRIMPSYQSADFKLVDGQKTYKNEITEGTALPISIPQGGTISASSDPVFIISNGTNATLDIPSIRINQFTNSLKISNFVLTPGIRYNLKLQVGCPCLSEANSSGVIDISEDIAGRPRTFTFAEADFGMEFDIYKLDNSFNMTINGKPFYIGSYANSSTGKRTANNEIQFQGFGQYPDNNLFPNIEFEDGTRWGRNGMSEIYHMDGRVLLEGNTTKTDPTKSRPILRISIDKSGNVKMYGSKNAAGGPPYYPLRLIDERSITIGRTTKYIRGKFNPEIIWKNNGTNVIIINQKVNSTTFLYGYVSGKKIVPCSSLTN